jgi:UDP-N-acetylglucosamine 2-epimerase (non-hydrolysing)
MKEVLDYYLPKIKESKILESLSLKTKKYFVVSTHREENVDNPENLKKIIDVLTALSKKYNYPIIVSTHPRTRKRIDALYSSKLTADSSKLKANSNQLKAIKNIHFLKPFGFLDYINLQMNAACTISDSGTISEESAILNFPAVSIRESMERPEAQDSGTIILTGFETDVVLSSIALSIKEISFSNYADTPRDYHITNTSWRVLKLITGLSLLSNKWQGLNQ